MTLDPHPHRPPGSAAPLRKVLERSPAPERASGGGAEAARVGRACARAPHADCGARAGARTRDRGGGAGPRREGTRAHCGARPALGPSLAADGLLRLVRSRRRPAGTRALRARRSGRSAVPWPSTADEGDGAGSEPRGLGSPVRARRGHAGFITCGGHHAIRAKRGSEAGPGREPLGPSGATCAWRTAGLCGRGVAVPSRLLLRGSGAFTLTLPGTPGREDTWGRAAGPSCNPGFWGVFFLIFIFAALLAAVRCYGSSGWLPGHTLLSGVLHRHERLYRVHLIWNLPRLGQLGSPPPPTHFFGVDLLPRPLWQ